MLNELSSNDLFCHYYKEWISVYKENAVRQVTLNKYHLVVFRGVSDNPLRLRLHEADAVREQEVGLQERRRFRANKEQIFREEVPVITIHGLRHTHASPLLFAGVSIASVAKRLAV